MFIAKKFVLPLAIVICIQIVSSNGLEESNCGGKCNAEDAAGSASSVFKYEYGKIYTYHFQGTTVTTLPGTLANVTVQLKAIVEMGILNSCSHMIQIKNLQVIDPDNKTHILNKLEIHPIIADFRGGILYKQICTSPEDSNAALDIKRAVLSLFIPSNTEGTNVQVVDIFGICPTNITSSQSGDTLNIRRTRNLNDCSHRENLNQEFLPTPFEENADLPHGSLLESTQTIQQIVTKGIIQKVVSEESHIYRPFAVRSAGACITTVKTQLILTGEKSQVLSAPAAVKILRPLTFKDSNLQYDSQAIIAAVKVARKTKEDDIAAGSDLGRGLIGVIQQSSKADILSAFKKVNTGEELLSKEVASKDLLDALVRAGTQDSIGAFSELLHNKEVPDNYSKHWLSGSDTPHPSSLTSLSVASNLLDENDLPREAILGIGSLAGRYCSHHNCNQGGQQKIDELISKLGKKLSVKISSREDENKVIATLIALQNIHHLNDAVAEELQNIASDYSTPLRVRVVALETYRIQPCRSNFRKSALKILNNRDEDSEVRIKAYSVLVECPSETVTNNVKELLENEPVNQVGAYIVSHLRNLLTSPNPSKADAKSQLGDLSAQKQYPEDIRKFSRNNENSYILDALNLGTSVESDVVFSQDSYIPRSVFLNLTTNLFGKNYNILELGTRVENADRLGRDASIGRSESTTVSKRSTDPKQPENIQKEIRKPLSSEKIMIDIYTKLFGYESIWLGTSDEKNKISLKRNINKRSDALSDSIYERKEFKHQVDQTRTLVNSKLIYPTGSGLPLKLIASGSITSHLNVSGHIDMSAAARDSSNALLQLEIVPSASVEVTGELLTEAFVVESGLKVAYTLDTATRTNVAVKILEGTGVDISFGLPLTKQNILTSKTEVLKTVHETGRAKVDTPVIFTGPKKEFHGCFDEIKNITGLVFCADVTCAFDSCKPSSAFSPLNGSSRLSLKMLS